MLTAVGIFAVVIFISASAVNRNRNCHESSPPFQAGLRRLQLVWYPSGVWGGSSVLDANSMQRMRRSARYARRASRPRQNRIKGIVRTRRKLAGTIAVVRSLLCGSLRTGAADLISISGKLRKREDAGSEALGTPRACYRWARLLLQPDDLLV